MGTSPLCSRTLSPGSGRLSAWKPCERLALRRRLRPPAQAAARSFLQRFDLDNRVRRSSGALVSPKKSLGHCHYLMTRERQGRGARSYRGSCVGQDRGARSQFIPDARVYDLPDRRRTLIPSASQWGFSRMPNRPLSLKRRLSGRIGSASQIKDFAVNRLAEFRKCSIVVDVVDDHCASRTQRHPSLVHFKVHVASAVLAVVNEQVDRRDAQ